ncbi:MAG: hypothetical protein KDG55_21245 [Rhodocyclaceae bacterium]|nr:hypothetical protein [Rhodocyclaceae bacterium]
MKPTFEALIPAIALTIAGTAFAAGSDAPYGKRVSTQQEVAASQTGSYDVYIDGPTGYAFVNTVNGWKFTRQVAQDVLLASEAAAAEADGKL